MKPSTRSWNLVRAAAGARCYRSAPTYSTTGRWPESSRGLADYVTSRRMKIAAVVRDRPRYAASFRGFCPALRPGLGGGRFKVFLFKEPRSTPLLSFSGTSSGL